jgi:hypothetical protein
MTQKVLEAIASDVEKHGFVQTAQVTTTGNLLVVPKTRSLRKSPMSHKSFVQAIKNLIVQALNCRIKRQVHTTQSHTKTKAKSGRSRSRKSPYVNKTRRGPAAVPVT